VELGGVEALLADVGKVEGLPHRQQRNVQVVLADVAAGAVDEKLVKAVACVRAGGKGFEGSRGAKALQVLHAGG
jgi:hypothetical protein